MTGYECFKLYLGIKLHFNSKKYDFFKYKGAVSNATPERFRARNDCYMFDRLANKYPTQELLRFMLANFLANPNCWIGDLASDEAVEKYLALRKNQEALSHTFESDLEVLSEFVEEKKISFKQLFDTTSSYDIPNILRLYQESYIQLESLLILNKILDFVPRLEVQLTDSILWKEFSFKLRKYESFMSINTSKHQKTFLQKFPDVLLNHDKVDKP